MKKKIIWVLIMLMAVSVAQDNSNNIQSAIDVTSPFSGIQAFFEFQLPEAVDSVVNPGQAAVDRVNYAVELQLEEVSVLEKYGNSQIDSGSAQLYLDNIQSSESAEVSSLNENPAGDATQEVNQIDSDVSAVEKESGSVQGGVEINAEQNSMPSATGITTMESDVAAEESAGGTDGGVAE